MKLFTTQNISRIIFLTLAISLVWYIVLANFTPLGLTQKYYSRNDKENISPLSPKSRVSTVTESGVKLEKVNEDLVYFTTAMPFHFDSATIKMTYYNDSLDQEIYVGYQDQETWHYDTSLFDSPLLSSVKWNKIGTNPVLYQKQNDYKSVEKFLKNPPKNKIIGVYNFEKELLNNSFIKIPDYQPSQENTVIDVPLRGSHTLYVYLENEPFKMNIEKQDINWYEGEDAVNIRIYKDKDMVYSADIADDGIIDSSHRSAPMQEVSIQNPGPGLPENGIYKVVIDAGGDSVIKKITTNLHKIVFANTIFLAGNKDAYPNVIKETKPTNVFTQSENITAITYHSQGLQKINTGDGEIEIDNTKEEVIIESTYSAPLTVPKNDVILKASPGYFAFAESQYFSPSPYFIVQIKSIKDLEKVDYLLSANTSITSMRENNWKESEYTFDLKSAVIKNGRLSWLIKAPRLKENNRNIFVNSIEVTFTKKALFKVRDLSFP